VEADQYRHLLSISWLQAELVAALGMVVVVEQAVSFREALLPRKETHIH
jgi:hypothetical protein